MATHATNVDLPRLGLRSGLIRWVDAFLKAMENHAARTPYARAVRQLEAKSDGTLPSWA